MQAMQTFCHVDILYPLPFKMHVSECLSDFNVRRCDEIRVFPCKSQQRRSDIAQALLRWGLKWL